MAVIGRNVHYVVEDGEYECIAMVSATYTSTKNSDLEPKEFTVHLHVFDFDPEEDDLDPVAVKYDVAHDLNNKPGTYHWPDECRRERQKARDK